jgi:hypothetical protein
MRVPRVDELGPEDADRVRAAFDLAGRAGARFMEVGFARDGVPADQADWYAHAQFKGARIMSEHHTSPIDAAEGLAVRILTGAKCVGCGKLVSLDGIQAFAFLKPVMADGSKFDIHDALKAGQCHWTRTGSRWSSACGV